MESMMKSPPRFLLFILLGFCFSGLFQVSSATEYISAIGDPGMRRDGLRSSHGTSATKLEKRLPTWSAQGLLIALTSTADPGTPPARRQWMSIDLGTEVYKDPDAPTEGTFSNFDMIVPK